MKFDTDFFDDYDDSSNDVENSTYQTFEGNLQRWLNIIDESAIAGALITSLTNSVELKPWLNKQMPSIGGMVGSGKIEWPKSQREYLAIRVAIFRGFLNDQINLIDFALHFFSSGSTQYDDLVRELNTQLFSNTARDLKKLLERTVRDVSAGDLALASDRIVLRSDNSIQFDLIEDNTNEVLQRINDSNVLAALEDKERLIAEIATGRDLIKKNRIRWGAIKNTILASLKYLLTKVAGTTLEISIQKLIALIALAFGYIL